MARALVGVFLASIIAAATAGAQAPAAPQTFTGCLKKGASGAYVLTDATAAKSPAAGQSASADKGTAASTGVKQSYSLVGVAPGIHLAEQLNKKIEVTGVVGEPVSIEPKTPSLQMRDVKTTSGSCS